MTVVIPRCGDHVFHRPSAETWTVAYADPQTGYLSWAGWPEGRARMSDCRLVYRATQTEHVAAVRQWLVVDHSDSRARRVRALYAQDPLPIA